MNAETVTTHIVPGHTYSAAEAARLLEVEKGTLSTAIRQKRIPAQRDEHNRYILKGDDLIMFHNRRNRHDLFRAQLSVWAARPSSYMLMAKTISGNDKLDAFLYYATNAEVTFQDVADRFGRSR